jgi:hypothetical protein
MLQYLPYLIAVIVLIVIGRMIFTQIQSMLRANAQIKAKQKALEALKAAAPTVLAGMKPVSPGAMQTFEGKGTSAELLAMVQSTKWSGEIFDRPYLDTYNVPARLPIGASQAALLVDYAHEFTGPGGRSGLAFVYDWLVVTRLSETTYGWNHEKTFRPDD